MNEYTYRNDLINDFKFASKRAFIFGTLFYISAFFSALSIAAPILPIPEELKSLVSVSSCCKSIEVIAVASLGVVTHIYNKQSIETVNQINRIK